MIIIIKLKFILENLNFDYKNTFFIVTQFELKT